MSVDIDALKKIALEKCPARTFYDLLDNIDSMRCEELELLSGLSNPNVLSFLTLFENCQRLCVDDLHIDPDDVDFHPLNKDPDALFVTLCADPLIDISFGEIAACFVDFDQRNVSLITEARTLKIAFI